MWLAKLVTSRDSEVTSTFNSVDEAEAWALGIEPEFHNRRDSFEYHSDTSHQWGTDYYWLLVERTEEEA